jgi:HTH-type transcriptional regulator/antitoxin HigA
MNPSLFQSPFSPDYGTAPGATLRDILEKLGLTQADLAERTGRPKKTINEIVQGKAAITPETALQFERVLGVPASLWNNLERSYRAAQARQDEGASLAEYAPWLKTLPVKEIVKRGWIKAHKDQVEQIREVLTFFGVAFPRAWDEVWAEARKVTALRQGQSRQIDFGTIAVWLRKGEIEGRTLACASYEEIKFREALEYLRRLTTAMKPKQYCSEIQARCAAAGVAVVFVPELPRLRVFGAARWLSSDKALIQLSLYYKREDQLWFSFFHEAGHILLHGRRDIFIDLDSSESDKQEAEANRFASDHLIPANEYVRFLKRGNLSAPAIQNFAQHIGISPGIVVGRLQHDRHLEFSHLNHLKRRLEWSGEQ